ncbi:hypothetical protein F383_24949 [Gossypium arboreum]|uniref:Uncharacterized protein n=1 Tax=Gossypium arboreum TaxID=29729 RepID=A0A0B0MNJ7_GOSAR|nr:hypothetical protein F383_24949 [Gossypium arboreum]
MTYHKMTKSFIHAILKITISLYPIIF